MIWLYRLIFVPALLILLPFFLWRTRGRGGWREHFGNRFGRFRDLPAKRPGVPRIWLQAVSVGELLAMIPLLEPLRRATGAEVFLTTTTTTGFALARERLAGAVLGPAYFPVDFWPWSARAWRTVGPDLVLLAEGERWPEHLHQAACRGVPVVCVNARLSDRGLRRARRFRWLAMPCWRGISRVLAGSETDAQRFRALGFPPANVQMMGSIKLDVDLPRISDEVRRELRRELGLTDGLVVVGASTWPGEEATLVELLRRARSAHLPVRLLLVPRHVERRAEIASLLETSSFRHHLRSRGPAGGVVDVAVGDTTGELRQFLQLADLVFIGRSLPPHTEGQTPIEAGILGRPMLFGPGMSNFRDIAAGLVAAGAARQVRSADHCIAEAVTLLGDANQRDELARRASAWADSARGAVGRTVEAIREAMACKAQA